jgi:hypothetical protein
MSVMELFFCDVVLFLLICLLLTQHYISLSDVYVNGNPYNKFSKRTGMTFWHAHARNSKVLLKIQGNYLKTNDYYAADFDDQRTI